MIDTHFTTRDIIFLATGIFLIVCSVVLFARDRKRLALWLLLLGGLSLRLLMAFIDPFLNTWDEQFHALVAKNLTHNYIVPVLVADPLTPLDPAYWPYTKIWLHKPPLFLWQMAVCIQVFGVHEWAIRLPSVLLSALMIPCVFRIGKLVVNERTGFLAALLIASSNILINVVSGFLNTDHNDVIFAAYVCFSFWAWTEYMHSPKKRWILLTGFFAGAAVLTKWLPGALVFGAWGIALLTDREMRSSVKSWLHLSTASLVALIVAAPWFVYVICRWPENWSTVMEIYSRHFTESMAHPGEWWFHISALISQSGWWFVIVCAVSCFAFFRNAPRPSVRYGLAAAVIAVYVFYMFVPTKMPLFCLCVLPVLMVIAATGMDAALDFISERLRKVSFVLCALLITFLCVNIGRLEHHHTDRDASATYRSTHINNRLEFLRTLREVPPDAVVFNCGEWNAVACMFYTTCTAYDQLPTEEELFEAKNNERPVYIFNDGSLPEELLLNPEVTILEAKLISNDL